MAESQTVTAVLKIVPDTSAARREVQGLAADVRAAADQQERLDRGRTQGRSTPGPAPDVYGFKDEWGGGKRSRSQAEAERVAAAARHRDRVAVRLRAMGLDARGDPLGPPDPVRAQLAPGLNIDYLGARAERVLGFNPAAPGSGALGYLGPAAAGAAGAKAIGDEVIRRDRIDAAPFVSQRSRDEALIRGLPGGAGRAFGYVQDLGRAVSGDSLRERMAAEYRATEVPRAELLGGRDRQADALRAEQAGRASRAGAFRDFTLDRVTPGLDRSTVAGERRFQEESRLLGVRRELTRATREQAAAQKTAAAAAGEEASRQREVTAAAERLEAARLKREEAGRAAGDKGPLSFAAPLMGGALFGVGGAALARGAVLGGRANEAVALAEEAKAQADYDAAQGRYQDAARRSRQATDEDVQSRYRRTQAEADLASAQADLGEQKAGQAADKAATLSSLGIGGRATAEAGLDILKRFGPEALTGPMRAAVGAVAPQTLQKADERYGEQFKKDFRDRGLVDADEPGFEPTDRARKRAAGDRETADQKAEGAVRALEQGLSSGFGKLVDKLLDAVTKVINQKVEQIRADKIASGLG